jgi:hypothetical protein
VRFCNQERFEEADSPLLQSYELFQDETAAQQQRTAQRLIKLYESWRRDEEAAKWRDKGPGTTNASGSL